MLSNLKLGKWNSPSTAINCNKHSASSLSLSPCCSLNLRRRTSRFVTLTLQSHSDSTIHYTATVGSPSSSPMLPPSHWNLTQRHLLALNVIACATAVSATWLFFSAIPTILAFKRAAESLEKLMDTTREELPDTMAAIRLSGMEISDLTMELSDLGQEITQGVRSSTRAVRVAGERLSSFTNMPSTASLQTVASPKTETRGPAVASTARGIKEGIVKGRSTLQMLFTLVGFSKAAFNYFGKRVKR